VTADATLEQRDAVRKRGVRNVILKPYDLWDLAIRARNLLEIRWLTLRIHRRTVILL
jgi:hypothetical protein